MIEKMAIMTRGLVKRYGGRRALDGFSLDVPAGCVLGLVGPNGAGKTTWMMSVAGYVRPDEGTIGLFGSGMPFDAARHSGRLAILPQDSELPLDAMPRSFLTALAQLQGLTGQTARAAVDAVLAAVNLTDRAGASVRSLSHGMRKRLMAAQCFLGNPDIVLLDEPFNGLDPEEVVRLRALICRGGRTTIISSHNLNDIEKLCTHVCFVENGRCVRFATIGSLLSQGESLESVYLNRNGRL